MLVNTFLLKKYPKGNFQYPQMIQILLELIFFLCLLNFQLQISLKILLLICVGSKLSLQSQRGKKNLFKFLIKRNGSLLLFYYL